MELRLAGYFPKHVAGRPDWLCAPQVQDVYSVSACVSEAPDGWVERWLHNDLGLYNTGEQALSVIPPGAPPMKLFAYKLSSVRYDEGRPEEWPWPSVSPEPLPDSFRSFGFDVVSKTGDDVLGFECSPLSCNGLASEWHANAHCLLDTLEQALEAARQFSVSGAEPGEYYIAEVFSAE